MSHNNVKRKGALALLVICVAGTSVMVTVSFEHYFIGPVIMTVTETTTPNLSHIPFNSSVYLSTNVGSCGGPAGFVPCFGGDFSQAEVFNCGAAATSPSGCRWRVVSSSNPQNGYFVTIWYPYVRHGNESSWANCNYTDSGDPGHYYDAYCVSINATAFIVTQPAPPPL